MYIYMIHLFLLQVQVDSDKPYLIFIFEYNTMSES